MLRRAPTEGSRALRSSKAITAWRTTFSADRSLMLGGVQPCWTPVVGRGGGQRLTGPFQQGRLDLAQTFVVAQPHPPRHLVDEPCRGGGGRAEIVFGRAAMLA